MTPPAEYQDCHPDQMPDGWMDFDDLEEALVAGEEVVLNGERYGRLPDSVEPAVTLPDVEPLLLTIDQTAKRLHVGRCTAQALLIEGKVRSLKIGHLRRVPVEAIEEYIASRSSR